MDIPKHMDIDPRAKVLMIIFLCVGILVTIVSFAPKPNIQKGPDITIHTRFYAGHTYLVFREDYGGSSSLSSIHSPDCTHIKCK